MKKLKIISILLSVALLLTFIPTISVSAATKKSIKNVSVVSVPDDFYNNPAENVLNGVKVKVLFSDSSTKEVTIDSDNTVTDISFIYATAAVNITNCTTSVGLYSFSSFVCVYVSDYINISFNTYDYDDNYQNIGSYKYTYPDSFVLPDQFAKDHYVYSKTSDSTVSIDKYVNLEATENDGFDPTAFAFTDLTVPDKVYDYSVTSIGDYALVNVAKSSVTIPKSITHIGDYGIGYNYDIDNNSVDPELFSKLKTCKDTDTFYISISCYNDDDESQIKYLLNKYFPNTDKKDIKQDALEISLYATKAQILSMKNEPNIYVYEYIDNSGHESVNKDLFKALEGVDDSKNINICVDLYESNYKAQAASVLKKYFGNTKDYTLDDDVQVLSLKATKAQIFSVGNDDSINIYADVPYSSSSDLYFQLIASDSSDKIDIDITNFEGNINDIDTCIKKYFSDCEFITISDSYVSVLGATASDVLAAVNDDSFELSFDTYKKADFCVIKNNDFCIYGYKNSAAQTYAKSNLLMFVPLDDTVSLGDVNLDGIIDINDATHIQKYLAAKCSYIDTQKSVADINKDGIIDVNDTTTLQKYLAGKTTI